MKHWGQLKMALIDKLRAIGDGFRESRGTTQEFTLDEMASMAQEPIGGSTEDLDEVLTEQEEIIAELTEELQKKTSGELNLGTCTVIINVPSKTNYYICREIVSDGAITYNVTKSYTDAAITQSMRCDSVMYIVAGSIKGAEVTDGEILELVSGQALVYKTPSLNNSIAQITLIG
jgi:hypothetical protein